VKRILALAALGVLGFAAAAPGADVQKLVPIVITISGEPFKAAVVADSVTVLKNGTPWKHHDIQGLDAPELEFTQGEPYRLQFELFFDRYEEGKSVRELTDKIEKLAIAQPRLALTWGTRDYAATLQGADQARFTLFLDDGTPVRAVLNTVWKEFSPAEEQLKANPRH
jgi:Contractile injection system tube protein